MLVLRLKVAQSLKEIASKLLLEISYMSSTNINTFWMLVSVTQNTWNKTYGVNEIEHHLLDILQFVKKHPTDKNDFIECFVTLLQENSGPLEIVEFCMRELQWQEIKEVAEQMQRKSKDIRLRDAMQRIIDVYSENWDDADLYKYYS
jgi:hypothetical protein